MNKMKYPEVFAVAFLTILSLSLSTTNSADARIFPPFSTPDVETIILGRTTDQQQTSVGDCSQYCPTKYVTTVEIIEIYYGELTGTILVSSYDLPYSDAYVPHPDKITLLGLTSDNGEYNTGFNVSYITGIFHFADRIQNLFGVTIDAKPENSIVIIGYKIIANLWLDEKVSDAEFASFGGIYTMNMIVDDDTMVSNVS